MGRYGCGGDDPEKAVNLKGCCNEDAVSKSVHGTAHQKAVSTAPRNCCVVAMRMVMAVMLMVMVMPQQRQTLEHKKPKKTRQQGGRNVVEVGPHMEAFRQKMQQGRPKKHARGETHQPIHEARETTQRDNSRQPNTEERGGRGGQQYKKKRHADVVLSL